MHRRIFVSFVALLSSAAAVFAQVDVPRPGFARYADGTLHEVFGVDSALVVGGAALSGVDAVSFSDAGGLVSANGTVQLVDRKLNVIAEYKAGDREAILNVDGPLTGAVAWLPSTQTVLHWTGTAFSATVINDNSLKNVLQIRMQDSSHAELLITASSGGVLRALVSLDGGYVTSLNTIPGVTGRAFSIQSLTLVQNENGFEIMSAAGQMQASVPFSAKQLSFERMSSEWIHIHSAEAKRDWALHIHNNAAQISELPQPRLTLSSSPAGGFAQ